MEIWKFIRQNREFVILLILSLFLAYFIPFVYLINNQSINFYDRLSGLIVSLLGLIITAYAIFVSFIKKLKDVIGNSDVLKLLNLYFLFSIILLFITNIFYVAYPLIGIDDHYLFRLLYLVTFGTTFLIVGYLFMSSRKFIQ